MVSFCAFLVVLFSSFTRKNDAFGLPKLTLTGVNCSLTDISTDRAAQCRRVVPKQLNCCLWGFG